MTNDRRSAGHESGHSLAAALLRIPVSLVQATDGGHTHYRPIRDDDQGIRDEITVAMAGLAADCLAGYFREIRGGDDLRVADGLAARLTTDPDGQLAEVRAGLRRAVRLLAAHRPALRELASTIYSRGAITSEADVGRAINVALAQRS